MLVVDLQPMRIQESGADQAFFARTDEHLGQQLFPEPLKVQGIPEVLEALLRGEFRLKRSQGDQVASIEDFFADDQRSVETGVDQEIERSLAKVERQ